MPERAPTRYIDEGFSSPGAVVSPSRAARRPLDEAELFWVGTFQPDQGPHVTPLSAVWFDGSAYFCTGRGERKAENVRLNSHCALITGSNTLVILDLVLEGDASEVTESERRHVADCFESKYGAHFVAPEGTWSGLGDAMRNGDGVLCQVAVSRVFGSKKAVHSVKLAGISREAPWQEL